MSDDFKFAKESLPEGKVHLYKFREFDAEHPDRVSRIITHHELYFPRPAELNDPFECRPIVRAPRMSTFAERWRAEHFVRSLLMRHGTPRAEAKRRARHASNREFMEQRAQEATAELPAALQKFRLCSFSATWEPILLWSHYADAHKGICIGFRADNDDFGSAIAIQYSSELPSVPFLNEETDEELLENTILVKAELWQYEEEYRLITSEPARHPQIVLQDHLYTYPAQHLSEVILGCEISSENEAMVRDWLGVHGQPVNLFKAQRSETKFELKRTPC